ncbi:hypothetical protein LSPH24S_05930 [Lysinibacillus sphaericus]
MEHSVERDLNFLKPLIVHWPKGASVPPTMQASTLPDCNNCFPIKMASKLALQPVVTVNAEPHDPIASATELESVWVSTSATP